MGVKKRLESVVVVVVVVVATNVTSGRILLPRAPSSGEKRTASKQRHDFRPKR